MIDMTPTITPKSSQLNADDLISGPITITVTRVSAVPSSADQPVAVYFVGDEVRPFLPCKSMRRVMVAMWGVDATKYAGRRMTLYRDPEVAFGGMKVGGIRISHMSHINEPRTLALTATRASRKPYTVRPLEDAPDTAPPSQPNAAEPRPIPLNTDADADAMKRWAATLRAMIKAAPSYGLAVTWFELNEETVLRIADRSPPLAAWIRESLPADEAEPNADDAPIGLMSPQVNLPPAAGGASSATDRSAT